MSGKLKEAEKQLRKCVRFSVEHDIDWTDGVSPAELRTVLDGLAQEYDRGFRAGVEAALKAIEKEAQQENSNPHYSGMMSALYAVEALLPTEVKP